MFWVTFRPWNRTRDCSLGLFFGLNDPFHILLYPKNHSKYNFLWNPQYWNLWQTGHVPAAMGVAVAAGIRSVGGVAWTQECLTENYQRSIFYLHWRWVSWWVGSTVSSPAWQWEGSWGGGGGLQERGRIRQYGGAPGCPHWSWSQCWTRAATFKSIPMSTLWPLFGHFGNWQRLDWCFSCEVENLSLLLLNPASPPPRLNVHLLPSMGELLLANLHLIGGREVGWLHLSKGLPLCGDVASVPLQIVMPVKALVAGGANALALLPPQAQGGLVLVVGIRAS